MKYKEILLLILIVIISSIYSFNKPDANISNIKTNKHIEITIEGKFEKTLSFKHTPKIKEIFQKLNTTNYYGFNDELLLETGSFLFIPTKSHLISLNSASIDELMTIKGIGPVMANKIIDYRQEKPFDTIEDLMNISGIGEKTYQKIREYFTCKK